MVNQIGGFKPINLSPIGVNAFVPELCASLGRLVSELQFLSSWKWSPLRSDCSGSVGSKIQ